jgi:circadian clock protein KaiC
MKCVTMGQGDRIRTFIHGFDERLGGGIPEGHVVLLAGEPGTMKSTIAFNLVYQNALREKRPGIYVSLEQGRDNLTRHLDQMSLSPRDVESRVSIVDLGMIRRNLDGMADRTWLEIFKMYATNLKRTLNYEVLVVDSLPVLEVMSRFESPREDLFQLVEWIRDLKATAILISEMKPGSEDFGKNGEEYLCDGIIHLKMERVDDANIQRRIRCVKMRGTGHSPNYYTLIFQDGMLQATRIIAD